MKLRQPGARPTAAEADWAGTVVRAAAADVQELLRRARRRRRTPWFTGSLVVLAVGVVVALVLESGAFRPVAGSPAGTPVSTTTSSTAPMLDVVHPFASTPAADWPDGAAGIVPPKAEDIGGFTAGEVAEATRQVRDVLVASRLDQRLLVGHDPSVFLGLLAPDARLQLEPLFGGGREPEVQSLVSMVAAGSTLLPVEAKVHGEMRVSAGEADELVVHTNYVFVYAFQPATPTRLVEAMNVLVVVRADVDYVLRAGDRWTPGSRGLWYDEARGFAYSIGCEAYRKGYLAPAASERAVTAEPREPGAYFDPTSPLPAVASCTG